MGEFRRIFLVLCMLIYWTRGSLWQERVSAVSFRQRTLTWNFDLPLPNTSSWASNLCASVTAPASCPLSALRSCCVECQGVLPTPGSLVNAPGCVCSPRPGFECLELSAGGSIFPTTPRQFALPVIKPSCRSFYLNLNTIFGEANMMIETPSTLTASQVAGTSVSQFLKFNRNRNGDDDFFVCVSPSPQTIIWDPYEMISTTNLHASSGVSNVTWIYVTVSATGVTEFSLEVRSLLSQSIPIPTLSNRVPGTVDCFDGNNKLIFSCQFNSNLKNDCDWSLGDLYSDQDSPFLYAALKSGLSNETALGPSAGLSLRVVVRYFSERGSYTDGVKSPDQAESCLVRLSSVVDATGAPVDPTFNFTRPVVDLVSDRAQCSESALSEHIDRVYSRVEDLRDEIDKLGTDLTTFPQLYGALISHPAWAACERLASSFVEAIDNGEQQSTNTTACLTFPNTTEYQNDPCCNQNLLQTLCCAPRLVDVPLRNFVPVPDSLSGNCQSPKCSQVVSVRRAQSQFAKSIATLTCADQIVASVSDPRLFEDPLLTCQQLLRRYEQPGVGCTTDEDCFTSCMGGFCQIVESGTNEALLQCILTSIPPQLAAVFFAGRNATTVLEGYLAMGCDQGSRTQPDETLNTPELCASAFACNSDPDLTEDECMSQKSAFPNMCARCDDGRLCTEYSVFSGCKVFPPVESLAECRKFTNALWRHGQCFVSGVSSQAACISRSGCRNEWTGSDIICDNLCMGKSLYFGTTNDCSCFNRTSLTGLQQSSYYQNFLCPTLQYPFENAQAGSVCHLEFEPAPCLAQFNGLLDFYKGGEWIGQGFLADQSSCLGQGQPSPFICTRPCANCSDFACGVCSDRNGGGYCWYPAKLEITEFGSVLECSATERQVADGCVNVVDSQSGCNSKGGIWINPSRTKADCESRSACFSPGRFLDPDGQSQSFSNLPQDECNKCSLETRSTSTWTQATLLDRTKFQWVPRNWTSGLFTWRKSFQSAQFSNDFSAARSEYLYLALSSTFSCLVGEDASALQQLACDCGTAPEEPNCYGSSLSFTAISTRVCGLFSTKIVVPGKLIVEFDEKTQFRAGCLDLSVEVIDSSTFSRSSSSVVSSAFVQSLQLRPLSIVQNSAGVVVGQLASGGYRVLLGSADELSLDLIDVISGDFQICVQRLSNKRQAGWSRLGVARARATAEGNFKSSTFRLDQRASSSVVETSGKEGPVCFSVQRSGIYALANYIDSASSASFFDTLTADQQAALIIVIIVYFFLWILISVALGNFVLWWMIQRTKVKFSVDHLKASLNFGLLWLASAIRWLYFLVVIVGAVEDMPKPVEIFMVELPLFFFFSVLTIIILKWLEVARKSGGKNQKPPIFSFSNVVALILNLVMYSLLVIFIILASVGVAEQDRSKCSTKPGKENPALSITYHLLVAIICFGLGSSFILIGTKVTIQLVRLGGATSQKIRFIQFTSVAGACSIAMILQAILLVITTAVIVPSIVAIVILIIVEVLPIILLIWTWNKPIALGKVISSITFSSRSDTTSSGSSGSSGTSSTDSPSGSASGGSSDTSTTSSLGSGGLARLWSLGTDSLGDMSVAEEE